MIKLTIDNSECQISGLTPTQFKQLKAILSYKISENSRYFSGNFSTAKYLIDRRGMFPTGLLYLVHGFLKQNRLAAETIDTRVIPKHRFKLSIDLKLDFTPYPEQVQAANACVLAERGIVVAPTGVGKSLICALIIQRLKTTTLIVVPSLELKKQLTQSLKEQFGAEIVGGLGCMIAVENVDGLDPKQVLEDYDCVIIDEFHHSGAKTYRTLNRKAWKNIYYKFGLTATPFRSNDNERLLLESVLSKVIYRIEYADAVHKGYIVPVEAYYVSLPKVQVEGYRWSEVYSELVVNRKDRNERIANLLEGLQGSNIPTLCLVKEIKHGETLQDLTPGRPAFAKGENDNNREMILEFNLGERTCLIGTTGVLGEGVDTKPAEYVIIAGLGKSKNAFMQQVGRAVRRHGDKQSAKVIIFKDESHKWTLAHFKAQVRYLKEEYGVIAVPL